MSDPRANPLITLRRLKVSESAYELVSDLEQAMIRMTRCPAGVNSTETGDAYAALQQRRKEVYHYIQTLEFNAGIQRQHELRY